MSAGKDSDEGRGGFWTYGRAALTLAAVLAVLLVVSTCGRGGGGPPPSSVEKGPGRELRRLPASILNEELWDLEGGRFRLADYGGRVVVLDVWATWCGPCREEIPHLVELSREYGPRGVDVVGLTVEDAVTEYRTVRNFSREFAINYRIGWAAGPDWTLKLTDDNDAIPQTFVIGRDGRVHLHATGFSDRTPALLREAIEEALNAER